MAVRAAAIARDKIPICVVAGGGARTGRGCLFGGTWSGSCVFRQSFGAFRLRARNKLVGWALRSPCFHFRQLRFLARRRRSRFRFPGRPRGLRLRGFSLRVWPNGERSVGSVAEKYLATVTAAVEQVDIAARACLTVVLVVRRSVVAAPRIVRVKSGIAPETHDACSRLVRFVRGIFGLLVRPVLLVVSVHRCWGRSSCIAGGLGLGGLFCLRWRCGTVCVGRVLPGSAGLC